MIAQLSTRHSCGRSMHRYASAVVGGVVWSAAVLLLHPAPFETIWAVVLLMLAPLVLVPLGLQLLVPPSPDSTANGLWRAALLLQLPAALSLGTAFLLPQGLAAAGFTLPWLATTGLLALQGVWHLWTRRHSTAEWCERLGLVYLSIGAAWAVLDRLGARPLDFEPVIVLLTAIHFHYAGFALPVLTSRAVRAVGGVLARRTGIAVVLAVPLVAVGITTTQLRWGPILECVSASVMAAAGFLTASLYFRLVRQSAWPLSVRVLWTVAAITLSVSMALAAAYGLRFYVPLPWLDIPAMRAWHGTANALGFALLGIVAWTLADHHRDRSPAARGQPEPLTALR